VKKLFSKKKIVLTFTVLSICEISIYGNPNLHVAISDGRIFWATSEQARKGLLAAGAPSSKTFNDA